MHIAERGRVDLYLLTGLVLAIAAGSFFAFRASRPADERHLAAVFSARVQAQVTAVDQLADKILANWKETQVLDLQWSGKVNFFSGTMKEIDAWSDNQFLPGVRMLTGNFKTRHIRTGAGDFLLRKWRMDEERFLAAIIPLHIHYKIQNEYLVPTWNTAIFGGYQVDILDVSAAQGSLVMIDGASAFRFELSSYHHPPTAESWLALISFAAAVLLLFLLLLRWTERWRVREPALRFVVLGSAIFLVRYLMIELRFPATVLRGDCFDPKYFASSGFNPSMADLVLNLTVVTLLCYLLFRNFFRFEKLRMVFKSGLLNLALSSVAVLAILFGFMFPFVVIQTIYNNSVLSLNISASIHFDSLRVLTFASVILAWVSAFLFIHVFVRILMNNRNSVRITGALLFGSVLFVLINEWSGQRYATSLVIGVIYILVVSLLKLYRSLHRFQYATFAYLFFALTAFSLDSFFAVQRYTDVRKVRDQFRFAGTFLIDRDDFGEFLMNETVQQIKNDLFIQTRLAGPFLNKDAVRQKVRQVFIPGYLNKYNIAIHLFSATGESLDESFPVNFGDYFSELEAQASPTEYEGVHLINRQDPESTRMYLVIVPIRRIDMTVGHIALELSLKRFIPHNVYPELLVDNRFQQSFRAQDFSYGVFSGGEIQVQSGDFNYSYLSTNMLTDSRLYAQGLEAYGFRHIAVTDQSGRIVVVSLPVEQWMIRIADFSFFFIIGLGTIMLWVAVIGVVDFLKHERLTLAARIQLVLNLSFFVPLIAVSIITLGLTARSTQEQLNGEYLAKSRNFSSEFSMELVESFSADGTTAEPAFLELASIMNLDANFFTPSGKLQFSTQPLIFYNNLVAPYINPVALKRILERESYLISSERVGRLSYFVVYSALNSPQDGKLLGIAAIPFFQSAESLERMQIAVLANILTIFTMIFAILLLVSYQVSAWLTFPLRMITRKLGRTSLTHSNQPLEWQSEDEIGLMVKEYNHMLATLGENKQELERTQRERAWREIAQQVAHEIKNPLTPMKLSLQMLERLSDNDPEKLEKIRRAIVSVLSQVDTLDGIASSFSAFAKMPEPVMTQVELVELVRQTIGLHEESAPIEFSTGSASVYVMADEQLLGRILSNILLNGIQSGKENEPIRLKVEITTKDTHCRISVSDNGAGIDETLRDRVFIPHFSTKKSGSGLGLAIARQGIEQMGGRIWFESSAGKGTTFYIDLPLISDR